MPCDGSVGRLDDAVCLVDLVTWTWWCEDGRLDGSSGGSRRPSLSESSGCEDDGRVDYWSSDQARYEV